jgi:hypothetical protein
MEKARNLPRIVIITFYRVCGGIILPTGSPIINDSERNISCDYNSNSSAVSRNVPKRTNYSSKKGVYRSPFIILFSHTAPGESELFYYNSFRSQTPNTNTLVFYLHAKIFQYRSPGSNNSITIPKCFES